LPERAARCQPGGAQVPGLFALMLAGHQANIGVSMGIQKRIWWWTMIEQSAYARGVIPTADQAVGDAQLGVPAVLPRVRLH
jgi:hypothetical protein